MSTPLAAVRTVAFALLCAAAGPAWADETATAAPLRARYLALQEQLANNQFGRPLYLESDEGQGAVAGDIYALVDYPFESAGTALGVPGAWCEVLILHMNTKGCRVTGAGTGLRLWFGRNHQQSLADAFQADFAYRVDAQSGKYLKVGLSAGKGPMGTRDYRIVLEAIPLENGKTFVHLGYSYGYDNVGRLAMQTYFATAGRNKVGFTVVREQADGRNRYVDGMRGMVERNAMRYYSAIEAFLGTQTGLPQARFEKRIRDWYTANELYPRQLHEVELGEYLDMKRMENLRQQDAPA